MTQGTRELSDREDRLNELLLAYLEAAQEGKAPDRQEWLQSHPEFAADLAEFFAVRDHVESLAVPLLEAVQSGSSRRSRSRRRSHSWGAVFPAVGKDGPEQQSGIAPPGPSSAGAAPLGQIGDFRLIREIGRGGMGIVYEAEQLSLHRHVALKVLPFAAAFDPKQLQRFKNEAQAAAQLHHSNIVPVFAVGSERGVHYYAMQYVEGQSLAAVIAGLRQWKTAENASAPARAAEPVTADYPLPERMEPTRGHCASSTFDGSKGASSPRTAACSDRSSRDRRFFRRVAELGVKAAEALEHAHQLGVVHRDIKPANLLVDSQGNLWITDFGLALFQNNLGLTLTGEVVGTLRYISPEQAMAKRGLVDHRTDIYSLGVTLYELLTLRPVFDGQDRHELMRQIAFEEPRPLRALDRSIPLELETIVLKAIAKNPGERYATAQELADDLNRFRLDKPILARRPTLVECVVKWARRHRSMVALGIAVLLLSLAGLLIDTVRITREQTKTQAALERERQKAQEAEEQRARAEDRFRQARQAVDFFTEICEEELPNFPKLHAVRRKMLEAALVYYEDFIDQRRDDPSLQAELATSHDRVTRILNELTALEGAGQFMLLTSPAVQDDIKLTEEQRVKVTLLADDLSRQGRELFRDSRKLTRDERRQKFLELAATGEKSLALLLTADQVKRLKQITLQHRVPEVFSDPEVVDALRITAAQREKLRAIQEDGVIALWTYLQNEGSKQEPPRMKPDEFWRVNTSEKILQMLTSEQQAKWRELTGQPFAGKFWFGTRREAEQR